jgi:hypothetical protein
MSSLEPDMRSVAWRKSRHSMNNGNCLEAGLDKGAVMVRDSTNSARVILSYSARAWEIFIAEIKSGNFDSPC